MTDFTKLLEVRRKLLAKDDPQIGETLLQIGIAFKSMGGSSKALANEAFIPLKVFAEKLLSATVDGAGNSFATPRFEASTAKTIERLGGTKQATSFAATTLSCLGNALANNSDDAKAKEAFKLSERCVLAESTMDRLRVFQSLLNLSDSWKGMGDYARSQELISKSTSLATDWNNSSLICRSLIAQAKLELDQADYSEAIRKATKALELAQNAPASGAEAHDADSLCECYKILAESSFALGKFDQAKQFAGDALALQGLKKQDKAYCLMLLGSALSELKQYEDAKKSLRAATELNDRSEKNVVQSTFTSAASALGYTLEKMGDHKGARYEFGWALGWDKSNSSSDGQLAAARDENGLALVETSLVAAKDADGDSERLVAMLLKARSALINI